MLKEGGGVEGKLRKMGGGGGQTQKYKMGEEGFTKFSACISPNSEQLSTVAFMIYI